MDGQDRTNWKVAWICCFMSFVLLGVARLSGLLFVVVVNSYHVSRSEASLPFVLCYTVRNIAGPLIGYLGRKLSLKKVCLSGCILSAAGIGLCFFAQNLLAVTILWGGIFGFGLGLGTVLIPEILRQHFTKDIAKANGIAFGGECLAGFLLPVLLDVSLRTYGTHGTFLILSGLVLNSIPAVLLLRESRHSQASDQLQVQCIDSNTLSKTTNVVQNEMIFECSKEVGDSKLYGSIRSSNAVFDNVLKYIKTSRKDSVTQPLIFGVRKVEESGISKRLAFLHEQQETVKYSNLQNGTFSTTTSCAAPDSNCHLKVSHSESELTGFYRNANISSFQYSKSLENIRTDYNKEDIFGHRLYHPYDNNLKIHNTNNANASYSKGNPHVSCLCNEQSICVGNKTEVAKSNCLDKPNNSAIKSFSVFLDFTFILMLLIQSCYIYIVTTVLTIIVDYAKDIGVGKYGQIYIVMGTSIADMIGRFCLGFVTDSGSMSQIAFSSTSFAIMGLLLLSSVWLRGFTSLMIVMFLFGLLLGGLLIVFPGIVTEFIGEENVTMALASRLSLYGPLSLTQSPLIGFFRGTLGSYDGVFYILSLLCFICSILTILTPCTAKRRKRR